MNTTNILDPRLNAYRQDKADSALQSKIDHHGIFVNPTLARIKTPVAEQYAKPTSAGMLINQLVFGEQVKVFEKKNAQHPQWAWVQSVRDDYVGYIAHDCLGEDFKPTHFVRAASTLLLAEPKIKAKTNHILPLLAEVSVVSTRDDFYETVQGWIPHQHVQRCDEGSTFHMSDLLQLALDFLGTPYLWGGKTRLGLDCSGLIQLLFRCFRVQLPRDTDLQQNFTDLVAVDIPKAGDLVFWPGHVGLMMDSDILLHAHAHAMSTIREPLYQAAARIKKQYGHTFCLKRWQGA